MTLIVAAIHKHTAFISCDTQLTNEKTGEIVEENASKTIGITCSDGHILMGFCGRAFIGEEPAADWLIEQASGLNLSDRSISEVVDALSIELNAKFGEYFPGHVPRLVLVAAGWETSDSRRPVMFTLTNCEDEMGSPRTPAPSFEKHRLNPLPNHTLLVIRGAARAAESTSCKATRKKILKLLSLSSNKLDEIVRTEMAKLIRDASADPLGASIGDKVMGSIMRRQSGVLDFRSIPESNSYPLPNFTDGFVTIKGGESSGHPGQDIKIVLGARPWPP